MGVETGAACFRSGMGLAYRHAAVWTQFYSKVRKEKLEVQSDAAPTSDWPGLSIGLVTGACEMDFARQPVPVGSFLAAKFGPNEGVVRIGVSGAGIAPRYCIDQGHDTVINGAPSSTAELISQYSKTNSVA